MLLTLSEFVEVKITLFEFLYNSKKRADFLCVYQNCEWQDEALFVNELFSPIISLVCSQVYAHNGF